jgi:tetratricopeptide (TPR) repeat protein
MTPSTKIGWGVMLGIIGLALLAIAWPVGLLALIAAALMAWMGVRQRREPKWQIRALLMRAQQKPEMRAMLIQQALQIDADNPEALAFAAENAYQTEDWTNASALYERYLSKAPEDTHAEFHLGLSYLNSANPDLALRHLERVRASDPPGESATGLINAIAVAFLKKDDPRQALELLKTLPLRRQNLDEQLQQALFLRALSHYGLRETSAAFADLDRLYALNPKFAGLEAARIAMKDGTFSLAAVNFHAS